MSSLLLIVKNAFSKSMNRDLIGLKVDGEPVLVDRSLTVAYAMATGEEHPDYLDDDAIAPPLFASRILEEPLRQVILHPSLGLNVLKMLHGEQAFTFHRPIPVGATVTPSATIKQIREVSTGEILDVSLEVSDEAGALTTGTASFFMITAAKGSGGKKKSKPKTTTGPAGTDDPGFFSREFDTAPNQTHLYARASGDNNPIHRSKLAAKLAGLPRPIMHGLCMMAMAGREITAQAEKTPKDLASLSVRFAKPAFPGNTYALDGREEEGKFHFSVRNKKSRPILTKGEATFR